MHTAEAKAFFGKMAQKYGKYPHVLYELYNEPVEDKWEDLKVYAKTIITEIRKYDPDNIILMGCPHIGTRILISWQRALSRVWRM